MYNTICVYQFTINIQNENITAAFYVPRKKCNEISKNNLNFNIQRLLHINLRVNLLNSPVIIRLVGNYYRKL